MIYFVDEDHRKLRPLVSELTFMGFRAQIIKDADAAYSSLSTINDSQVELVIIDVMLSAKGNGEKSKRFSRERTEDYHQTGLVLLDDLVIVNPDVFPKKAIFMTHASSSSLIAHIEAATKKHNIEFLRKTNFDTALEFTDKVIEVLGRLRS